MVELGPLDAVPAAPSLPRCSLVQKEDATTPWTPNCSHSPPCSPVSLLFSLPRPSFTIAAVVASRRRR